MKYKETKASWKIRIKETITKYSFPFPCTSIYRNARRTEMQSSFGTSISPNLICNL